MATSSNKNSSSSGNTAGEKGHSSNATGDARKSDYAMVKEGWGNRNNFQASYGLGMDPDGLEEGQAILDGLRKCDENESRTQGK